jgi:hypothetical protein
MNVAGCWLVLPPVAADRLLLLLTPTAPALAFQEMPRVTNLRTSRSAGAHQQGASSSLVSKKEWVSGAAARQLQPAT